MARSLYIRNPFAALGIRWGVDNGVFSVEVVKKAVFEGELAAARKAFENLPKGYSPYQFDLSKDSAITFGVENGLFTLEQAEERAFAGRKVQFEKTLNDFVSTGIIFGFDAAKAKVEIQWGLENGVITEGRLQEIALQGQRLRARDAFEDLAGPSSGYYDQPLNNPFIRWGVDNDLFSEDQVFAQAQTGKKARREKMIGP